ncbi:MAG: DUF362 domain-containing protein [Spirochaetota bacterium]
MSKPKNTVSIIRAGTYDPQLLVPAVEKAIELAGGIAPLRKKGKKLLLKVNMLAGVPPQRAVTTHPAFFEAAIIVFQKYGFTLFAGDAPAVESTHGAGKRNGLRAVAEKYGVTWVDFADAVELPNPEGLMVKKFTVAKIFTEVDAIVSMPKLKTHSQMYYTGALKNMFGAVHGLEKSRFHVRFPERARFARMIVDLNVLLKPDFALMDAVVSMEGNGPQNGDPVNTGLVLASYDPLALDTVCCRIIGYDPAEIPILKEAYTRRIWISSPDSAVTAGEKLSDVSCPDFKKIRLVKDIGFGKEKMPAFLYNAIRNIAVPRPFFNRNKCIVCKRCVDICQAGALCVSEKNEKKYISIDYSKCIRCYCCHEICPADAIILKRGLL